MKYTKSAFFVCLALAAFGFSGGPLAAQTCPADFCDNPVDSICDDSGFLITFTGYEPASASTDGYALYTYEVCSPDAGTCSLDPTRSCLDNNKCAQFGAGECTRECAVDSFRDLSHFDIGLPEGGCLDEDPDVIVTCSSGTPSFGPDGSCDGFFSAKCDNPDLEIGGCLTMTLGIMGETNGSGPGSALVVTKASTTCEVSCITGPSCEPCGVDPGTGAGCLTRTIGFWGTHPQVLDDFVNEDNSIEVCGNPVWQTVAGECDSVTEALCSTPGHEYPANPPYVTLLRQLAAAKTNLVATASLDLDGDTYPDGNSCSDYTGIGSYADYSIQEIIADCEANYCGAGKHEISESGCIEALADFNESQDTGIEITPPPFDRPGPAQPEECKISKGTGRNKRLVIGVDAPGANNDCTPVE